MPFRNRVRLPIHPYTPQFPTEANRFRLANGVTKTQSVTIRKTYEIRTENMSEGFHQKLVIALNHDDVTIEGDKYIGGITVDGEYAIEWPEFLDYPLGAAKVTIQVTPFDATNTNCATCDVLTQLTLVDDDAGEFTEGEVKQVDTFANDTICCFPPVATIVSFNTGYLDSATIDPVTGIATLTAKDPATTVGSIVMATYRVTCPDGSYDEADIYGSISGSAAACEQPSGILTEVEVTGPPFAVVISWTDPAVVPSGGYEWQLFTADNLGTPILTGTTGVNSASFDAPNASTDYVFSVRSNCGEGVYSPYTNVEFSTVASGLDNCGSFQVVVDDGTLDNLVPYSYSYMDCGGTIVNAIGRNLRTYQICMLMDAFNNPVYFESDDGPYFNVTYTEPC